MRVLLFIYSSCTKVNKQNRLRNISQNVRREKGDDIRMKLDYHQFLH